MTGHRIATVLHALLLDGIAARGIAAAAAVASPVFVVQAHPADSPRPNVVLVMADDLGWGDVGFNGSEVARTPHLDAMAAGGLVFDRFYSAAPVCSPTRGSCLTGRHPYRYGITNANTGHLLEDEVTLAELLKEQGYVTAHFGKWHLGTLTKETLDANRGGPRGVEHYALPTGHGFDVYFSTESKVPTWDPMLAPKSFGEMQSLRYGWLPVDEDGSRPYGTRYWDGEEHAVTDNLRGDDSRVIVDRAVAFVQNAAKEGKPFLAVVWFHAPHLPVVAGREYRQRYADRPLRERLYFGCISALDDQVGRLRKTLREAGVAEDTLVWFASDNGPENRTPGSAGPFRGRKRSLYEGGVRVPAILEWPAKIREPRRTDVPAVTSDYLPTMLDVLNVAHPDPSRPLDGTSLLPQIEGTANERPRPIGFRSGGAVAWNDNRFKLVGREKDAEFELFDLVADPGETKDVSESHPDVVDRMRRELRAWLESVDASTQR